MTDSTPPIDPPPEQESAGVPGRYGTAARAPPLRLQLEVGEPLLRLTRFVRSVVAQAGGAPRAEEEDQPPEPAKKGWRQGRLRRVAMRSLQLGQRKIARTDEVDVVAKFLYNKPQKIVCQVSRGDSLVKCNILWSKIRAMSARFDDARFDTLTIEAKTSSEQYRAERPQGRNHIQWQRCEDLTARNFRLEFDKGTLELAYGKMLYTDPSLMLLTLPPPPPPPPPGGNEEDKESQASADTPPQTSTNAAAAPVPQSVDDVEAETSGTRTPGSTNTGANTQLDDPSVPPHMRPFYRFL